MSSGGYPIRPFGRLPRRPTPWHQDEDCVGQDDPVSLETIPMGRGFKLEDEKKCYDIETMVNMKRIHSDANGNLMRPLLGPLTRIPLTPKDIRRIDEYINSRSRGGKKKQKQRKSKKTNKKRTNKKRTRRNRN